LRLRFKGCVRSESSFDSRSTLSVTDLSNQSRYERISPLCCMRMSSRRCAVCFACSTVQCKSYHLSRRSTRNEPTYSSNALALPGPSRLVLPALNIPLLQSWHRHPNGYCFCTGFWQAIEGPTESRRCEAMQEFAKIWVRSCRPAAADNLQGERGQTSGAGRQVIVL
jgi:hypothetical protein